MTESADPGLDPYATGLASTSGEANASMAATVRARYMRPRPAAVRGIQDMLISSACVALPRGIRAGRQRGCIWGGSFSGPERRASLEHKRACSELESCVFRARRVRGLARSGPGLAACRRLVGIEGLLVLALFGLRPDL